MNTKTITAMALFSAISIIATRFLSFMIPLGGFPSLSIGLGGIPIMLGGIIFGPLAGAIIGGVSDIIGFLINDRGGIYHVGFTLNSILTGLIPGLVILLIKKNKTITLPINIINRCLLIGATAVGIYYLLTNQQMAISPQVVWILITALLVTCVATLVVIQRLTKKEETKRQISVLVLCVLLVEILVYVGLTPIWIYGLYGIPSIVSIISRVLRMVFLIPIKVLVLIAILKATTKSKDFL